ncbi:MAG: acyl-CoA thioesterase [Desulfuromonadales bacterium]
MKQRTEVEFEVRYAETDQMGIVHHANYLVWFEVARTRFCVEAGKPYPEIEALGYYMIITRAQQDYRLAACYGDTVRVACWLDWVASRSLQFSYRVSHEAQLLSTGYTRHLWVKRESRRPCSMPESLRDTFLKLAEQAAFKGPEKRTPDNDSEEKMLCL